MIPKLSQLPGNLTGKIHFLTFAWVFGVKNFPTESVTQRVILDYLSSIKLISYCVKNDLDGKLTFDSKILDHFFYKSCPSRPKLSGTLVHEKIQLKQFLNMASDILDPFLNKTYTWIPEPFIRPAHCCSKNPHLKTVFLFHTAIISSSMNIFLKSQINGNPSKNPDIKTPLVVSFSLGDVIHFSPLAAF